MKRFLVVLAAAGALVVVAGPALAQETHSHSHGGGDELGTDHGVNQGNRQSRVRATCFVKNLTRARRSPVNLRTV